MHTNETKDRFIELRAQGLSLAKIASDLGVSKRTLVDWNHEFRGFLHCSCTILAPFLNIADLNMLRTRTL